MVKEDFLKTGSLQIFEAATRHYNKAIIVKYGLTKRKGENLIEFDRWYQEELPATLAARSTSPHLEHHELVLLMRWKLARGKWRPRLVQFAESNSEELVRQCTADGIRLAHKDVTKALAAICKLKGVGPATASAVLAAAAPLHCGFFADEVAYAALGVSGGLKYTVQEYLAVNDALVQCAARLNKAQGRSDDTRPWGPHTVELALWSYSVLSKHKPQLLVTQPCTAGKRKSDSKCDSPIIKKSKSN